MPAKEYSWEIRQQAWELYVYGGLNFAQMAATLKQALAPEDAPSESQLKRWSAEQQKWEESHWSDAERQKKAARGEKGNDWPADRKEYRLAQGCSPRKAVLLRYLLINKAIDSDGEFKRVLAAAMWEKTQGRGGEPPVALKGPPPAASAPGNIEPGLIFKTPQDAVSALEGVMAKRINLMATQPGLLTFQAIKDLKQTLVLIEELKLRYQPEEAAEAPMDGEVHQRLVAEVNKILGVK